MKRISLCVLLLLCLAGTATAQVIEVRQSDMDSGPYYMTQQGATYRLVESVRCDGSGLVFAAKGITLDLNGKQVLYGSSGNRYRYGVLAPPPYAHSAERFSQSDVTIYRDSDGATVRNGHIEQCTNHPGAECAAVYMYETSSVLVDHVDATVCGDDAYAIWVEECLGVTVTNCLVFDLSTRITNRHAGRAGIDLQAIWDGPILVANNTVEDARQWGIRVQRRKPAETWGTVRDNVLHQNTICANGYGVGLHADRMIAYGNIVTGLGRGIHVENAEYVQVYGNQVDVREVPTWEEYDIATCHGIKLEALIPGGYCRHVTVYNNNITTTGIAELAGAVGSASALNIGVVGDAQVEVYANTFIARHEGGSVFDPNNYGHYATALEINEMQDASGVRIWGNHFITQDRFVTVGYWHGEGYPDTPTDASGIEIIGNDWQREPTSAPTRKYDAFYMSCTFDGLIFKDNDGVADFTNIATGWPWAFNRWGAECSGTIRTCDGAGIPVPGAMVKIRDASGLIEYEDTTGADGRLTACAKLFDATCQGNPNQLDVTQHNPWTITWDEASWTGDITEPDWLVALVDDTGEEPGEDPMDKTIKGLMLTNGFVIHVDNREDDVLGHITKIDISAVNLGYSVWDGDMEIAHIPRISVAMVLYR